MRPNNAHPIDFKMTKKMFNSILDTRTEAEKNINPYTFVTKVINDEYGFRGTVKRILIHED